MPDPVPVLFVSHFPHMRMGGQRSMAALIEHLDRTRFRPMAAMREPGELSEHLHTLDCPVFFLPLSAISLNTVGRMIKSVRTLRRIFRAEKIAVVHPDAERDVMFCGLAKLGLPTKLVWHARVTGVNGLDPLALRFADRIIGISDAVRDRFPPDRIAGRYRTIYNGVDLTRFNPADDRAALRRAMNLPVERPLLLFAGQIKEEKGIYEMVEAMRLLGERRTGADLPLMLMMGEPVKNGVVENLQAAIAGHGLESDLLVLPQQEEIERWMAAADVLLLPSHEGSEGMGRVIFEGMACGTVPIASDISGVREAVTPESGLLVPEKSPALLADAIERLLDNADLYATLRKGGIARAREVFDIRVHARKVEEVYEEMLAEGGRLKAKG